jgi:hypothetical protein
LVSFTVVLAFGTSFDDAEEAMSCIRTDLGPIPLFLHPNDTKLVKVMPEFKVSLWLSEAVNSESNRLFTCTSHIAQLVWTWPVSFIVEAIL